MDYQGIIYRPPSEAASILLQVTIGCSHNKCSFCGMYKDKRFAIKDKETIFADIDYAARHYPHVERLFLCDGDTLIVPQKRLVPIFERIRERLPRVRRIGIYANSKSLEMKSLAELRDLCNLGLGIIYMGLESGDDQTLVAINKGDDAATMIAEGRKVKEAGIRLSVTVLLGIAGLERSEVHARETGRVLSAIDPDYVGALTLMLEPGTPLWAASQSGQFVPPGPLDIMRELRTMIDATNLGNGLFHANHASNYLPIRASLPEDKKEILALLDQAIKGRLALKDESLRAL